jgi:hypothetical protein
MDSISEPEIDYESIKNEDETRYREMMLDSLLTRDSKTVRKLLLEESNQ